MAGEDSELAREIGIGAILGAPFTLATLAMFVVGASALAYRKRRGQGSKIRCQEANAGQDFPWCRATGRDPIIDEKTIARDMLFFLVFFTVAAASGLLELPFTAKVGVAVLLTVVYADYVRRTLHSSDALEEVPERLTVWRFQSRPPLFAVLAQALFALGLMVVGAQIFVHGVEGAAEGAGLPASLISLVLAPLATELPESQFRSVDQGRQGHSSTGQRDGGDALPEHDTRDPGYPVYELGPGTAEPVLRRARARLGRHHLRRATKPRDAPTLAPDDRRLFLPLVPGGCYFHAHLTHDTL